MFGLENETANSALNEAWKDPSRPPWQVRNSDIELRKIRVLAPYLARVRSVLDCGCGGGDFLDMVIKETGAKFEDVSGLDVAHGALVRARQSGHYAKLVKSYIDQAPQHFDRTFDLVLLSDVLSHVKEYVRAVSEVADLVSPGGLFFISCGMGKKYFDERDTTAIKSILASRGLHQEAEVELDYLFAGVPRRLLPLHDVAWPQTHKVVLIYRKPA